MRAYQIITDTDANLPVSFVKEYQIPEIPQYYSFGDEVHAGVGSLSPAEFYKRMRDGEMPQSQGINPAVTEETFRAALDAGKDVLYISFAATLSGSYGVAVMVAKELQEEYPEAKILCIDSNSISLSEGLLVVKAVKLQQEGKSIDETAAWLENYKQKMAVVFTVDDMNHLYRGGRISKAVAILGTTLNLKPLLNLTEEGTLVSCGKVRGRKRSYGALVDYMAERLGTMKDKNDWIGIVHGDCEEDALALAELVKERFGFENFMIEQVNPSIGTHSGPGALGLIFLGERR